MAGILNITASKLLNYYLTLPGLNISIRTPWLECYTEQTLQDNSKSLVAREIYIHQRMSDFSSSLFFYSISALYLRQNVWRMYKTVSLSLQIPEMKTTISEAAWAWSALVLTWPGWSADWWW